MREILAIHHPTELLSNRRVPVTHEDTFVDESTTKAVGPHRFFDDKLLFANESMESFSLDSTRKKTMQSALAQARSCSNDSQDPLTTRRLIKGCAECVDNTLTRRPLPIFITSQSRVRDTNGRRCASQGDASSFSKGPQVAHVQTS